MFQTSRTTKRLLFSCVGAILALAGTPHALRAQTMSQDFEIGITAGGSFFKEKDDPLKTDLQPSGRLGISLTENFSQHLGLEQEFAYMQNNLQFTQNFTGTLGQLSLSQRILQFQNSLLFYTAPKTHAIRPYLSIGIGLDSYRPMQDAINYVLLPDNAGLNAAGLQSDTKFSFTYGGGIKARLSKHFGVRADVRGLLSRMPHYGLLNAGAPPELYIPNGGVLNGLQVDGGLMLIFGHTENVIVSQRAAFSGVTISPANPSAVCAGTPVAFTATVNDLAPSHVANYRWTVDGHNAGDNSPNFSYTPTGGGSHQIGVTIVDTITPLSKQAAGVTLTVNEHTPPSITANADKTDLQVGDKAMLYPHPQAGQCPGSLTVTWSANDGAITGTDPATFDSASVQLTPGQPKQVIATATVTDSAGGSSNATVNLTINKAVQIANQPDVVFPTGNDRVNNCGKRVLIDQVYPALTSGQYSDWDVLLVGHAGNEPRMAPQGRRGRRAAAPVNDANLAQERAENVARILASGQGICPKPGIDVSRIKIATVGPGVGPDVNSPCVGSTQDRERRGAAVKGSPDQLKDQRVEIILLPKGANLPSYVTNAQQAPDSMKSVCPK